jgi:SAM-dependent methyltransferase
VHSELYAAIANYYTQKVTLYDATPLGVDWSCFATQELRFVHLLRVCNFSTQFSLNDLGCGYGALLTYLRKNQSATNINYLGIDVAAAMIRKARKLWRRPPRPKFVIGHRPPRIADYSVASGLFNVRLGHPTELWERFIVRTLIDLHATSRRGFAVNFLAPLDSGQTTRLGLYRTSPAQWTEFCEQKLNCSVQLIGAYGLREFTLVIRKMSRNQRRQPNALSQ